MKFFKLVLIVAFAAPMFLTSCGDKQDGDYSFSFDVPDSVAYNYGMYDAARLGVQSMDLDEFEKAMKKGFAFGEDDKAEIDSANVKMEEFSTQYAMQENAKKAADSTYQSAPMDLPKEPSYHLGILVGSSFTESPLAKMDINDYLNGVKDYFADKSSYNQMKANEILTDYFALQDSLRIQVNEKYLADNKEKEGVITTPTGLQYKVITEGEGEKPEPTDQVKVHYKGTFVDGKTFDSSYDRGEPITFALNGVIPGWTEGVGLMNVGSKYEFVIPQDLAYGERGRQNIPPKSTLVFEVELIEINPTPEQPQLPINPNNMTEEEMKKMIEEATKNSKK